jgi:hypothetical protein
MWVVVFIVHEGHSLRDFKCRNAVQKIRLEFEEDPTFNGAILCFFAPILIAIVIHIIANILDVEQYYNIDDITQYIALTVLIVIVFLVPRIRFIWKLVFVPVFIAILWFMSINGVAIMMLMLTIYFLTRLHSLFNLVRRR